MENTYSGSKGSVAWLQGTGRRSPSTTHLLSPVVSLVLLYSAENILQKQSTVEAHYAANTRERCRALLRYCRVLKIPVEGGVACDIVLVQLGTN